MGSVPGDVSGIESQLSMGFTSPKKGKDKNAFFSFNVKLFPSTARMLKKLRSLPLNLSTAYTIK